MIFEFDDFSELSETVVNIHGEAISVGDVVTVDFTNRNANGKIMSSREYVVILVHEDGTVTMADRDMVGEI